MEDKPNLKPVDWRGDSLRVLRSFPEEVQDEIGYALFLVQSGIMPANAKPLTGIANDVFDIFTLFDGNTYFTVY